MPHTSVHHAPLTATARRGSRTWLWFLALCAAAVAVFWLQSLLAGARWTVMHAVAYDAVTAAAGVAVLVGLRRHRPERPLGWRLVAVAIGLIVAANLAWDYATLVPEAVLAIRVADLLYLVGYPVGAAALFLVIRQRGAGTDRAGLLDALIVATGLGLLYLAFLALPLLTDPTLPPIVRLISLASPLLDITLLALATRLAAAGGRAFALQLAIAAVGILLATDTIQALRHLSGAGDSTVLHVGWMAWYALMGAAALHPSMRVVNRRTIPPPARLTRVRVTLLTGVAVATPTVLALGAGAGRPVGIPLLLGGSTVLLVLVVARLTALVGDERDWAELHEAEVSRIVYATEQERGRIAADLHDGPIQRLSGVSIAMELVRSRLERRELTAGRRLLDKLAGQLGDEIRALRRFMLDLSPPELDRSGLHAALRHCAAEFHRSTGIDCRIAADHAPRLDPTRETVVYRVVQEALNNVAKHADAQHAAVRLAQDGETARLEVHDDGVGFMAAPAENLLDRRHFGLVGMRQRVAMAGGVFKIRSTPGHGTVVTVHLPLPSHDGPSEDAATNPASSTARESFSRPGR